MDNLAINDHPQALSQYSRHQIDRTYADQYESVLGHLICERGRSVKAALEDLRPIVSQTRRETLSAVDWCQKLGFGGLGVGILVGAGMGMGFAILPILAGTISLKFWADSRSELPRRDAEYHLLKTTPNLPEALYALHLRGVTAVKIVGAYDQLVAAIEARLDGDGEFTEAEVGEFLQVKVSGDMGLDVDTPSMASTETQAQSGIQNSDASNAPRTESVSLAQTELQAIAAVAPSMQHIVSPVWDPAQDLGENPQSALIVGVPGSGKGVLISSAVRVLKAKCPNLKVFVIDPKASPKERGYWESIADEYRAFSLKNCEDPDEGAAWLLSCMDAFRRLPGPKLCIFDELMTAATELELSDSKMKALPKLKKFVVGLVGQGDSEAEWLWAMTQSPQVKDLGMSGGVRANLRVIGLVSPKNMTAVEALVSTQLIPKPDGGMDELRSIMAASPVGRAVFDGKIARWLPMPKLENHSGFDRDNRSLADEVPPPSDDGGSYWISPGNGKWTAITSEGEGTGDSISAASDDLENRLNLEKSWGIDATEIDVETSSIIDRPEGLDDFPLVATVWDYLNTKDPRSLKQISDSMRAKGKIPEDVLRTKIGGFETYKDAIKTVVTFGVSKGYLRQVSEDTYEAIQE